jgi:prepilin-type N-terminal cleavage/methylation domain-containing protein
MHVKSGFTLIELMAVMLIIGVISAIAAVNYISYVQRAQIAEVMRYAKSMQDAYAQYYVQNGSIPASLASLNLTSISTNMISYTAYNSNTNQLQVSVNMASLDADLGAAGCTMYFLFTPIVNGDILTWSCTHGSNVVNQACVNLVAKVLPAECT